MALVNWNDSLRLGFDPIDQQHHKLIDIVNEVHASILSGRSQTVLSALLMQLVSYTQTHFRFEEQLFRRYKYPESAAHCAQHMNLARVVLDFKVRFDCGSTALSAEVMHFLIAWLSDHISGSDREFVVYLKTRLPSPMRR